MSDVGVISHEYRKSSELAKRMNDALIIVKKIHYQLPSSTALSGESISESRHLIVSVLRKLLDAFSAKAQVAFIETPSEIELPSSLLQRIRTRQRPKLTYYLADLRRASEHLEQGIEYLTDNDLRLLDDVCAAMDLQTTTIFQKFWKE
jgi:hypothetical protein